VNGAFELANAVEGAAANGFIGYACEPTFDQIQPGRARGCEVEMEAGMTGKPLLHLGMLVGAVVVADEVQVEAAVPFVENLKESNELLVRMPIETSALDTAGRHLEGCEKACCAVPFVVVSHPRRHARTQGKYRLRPVERLDLGLLVDAEDQRFFGRIKIERNDVGEFGVEIWVGAELEVINPMRLQATPAPHLVHARRWQAEVLGQFPHAPMRADRRWSHGR